MTRTLHQHELIGLIREKGDELIALIADITRMQNETLAGVNFVTDDDYLNKMANIQEAIRWTNIGKDQVQQGIMALNRSLWNQRYFKNDNQPKE